MWDGFDLPGAVAHELRGYGRAPLPEAGTFSHADDLEAALGEVPAQLVGASFGGLVCLEVAARRPDLVSDLVLLDAPLPDHEWSEQLEEYSEQEERLLEQGDLDGATALNVAFWAPTLARTVAPMQRRAFELQAGSEDPEGIAPDTIALASIRARTLVVVGKDDYEDFHAIARRLHEEIQDAELAVVQGAGHLPSLERPEHTAAVVRSFLGRR
jgi:3-oxoadipate enol-lactonase